MRSLLRKNFILLFCGQVVSLLGTMMQSFVLSLYVLDTTGSGSMFASVLAISVVPRFLLSPFAGVLADRFNRKRMVVLLDILSGCITLAFATSVVAAGQASIILIYCIAFVNSTISVFFNPPIGAMLPELVGKEDLTIANSAFSTANSIVSILAPVIAGAVYAQLSLFPLLCINGVSFLLSALSECFIDYRMDSSMQGASKQPYKEAMKEGWTYIRSSSSLLMLIGVAFIANFAFSPIASIGVNYLLRQELRVSEVFYGAAQSLIVIGSLLGALAAPRLNRKYHFLLIISVVLIACSTIAIGIALIALPIFDGVLLAVRYTCIVTLAMFSMLLVMISGIASKTAIQKSSPIEKLGRVLSVKESLSIAAVPLGQLLFGVMIDTVSLPSTIGIFALILLLSGVLSFGFHRNLRSKSVC